ncbi:glycine cleavage system protein GcvH [Geomonas sp. RF6]|uniref:glycine cleavage system protein GcvH n=1 Tax=Geomonas sp. RF6 TaxID=2897342 RepID=UPI001E53920C|nr:glycine cleavage system protein GcvH [Geomonas sp. RF6]UFS71673.1 glycine cleavage system protein GcvH [Geomonas sp. RF6]
MTKYYTKEHEWVEVVGEVATVGISVHAAHELGDITFIELPATGKTVSQSEVLAGIESVKAASDVYAPLSGTVIEVNPDLESAPEIVNQSAEGEGWLCKLEPADLSELSALMDEAKYQEYLKGLS